MYAAGTSQSCSIADLYNRPVINLILSSEVSQCLSRDRQLNTNWLPWRPGAPASRSRGLRRGEGKPSHRTWPDSGRADWLPWRRRPTARVFTSARIARGLLNQLVEPEVVGAEVRVLVLVRAPGAARAQPMRLGYGGNQSNPHRLKYRLGWQEGSTSEESKNFSESEGEGGSGCHRVDGSKGQGQGQRKSGRAEGPSGNERSGRTWETFFR